MGLLIRTPFPHGWMGHIHRDDSKGCSGVSHINVSTGGIWNKRSPGGTHRLEYSGSPVLVQKEITRIGKN